MGQLHLSTQLCTVCEKPMVQEWVGYIIGPHTPRHASCVQFAKVWAEHRDWFVPAEEPAES